MAEDVAMQRRRFLELGVSVGGLSVTGCLSTPTEPQFQEGFEQGIGEWESQATIGPEVAIEEFEWDVSISTAEAKTGDHALKIWNEGDYDDGVTWVVHPIAIESETAYQARVSTHFWSESESFNTLRDAVMRLGPEPPTVEEDFPQPGLNTTDLGITAYGGLREPLWLTDGWREYSFKWTSPTLTTDTLYIALGTSVIWEGDATHYLDDVTVNLEPR